MRKRTRLFSITKKDFVRSTFKGSGAGGQKRNKTSNGIRLYHPPSGAVGEAVDTRVQSQNEKLAFERLTQSKEFQGWLQIETDCHMDKVKLEVKDGSSWTERPIFSKLDG
jgi:protein subunit release factor B